MRDYASLQSLFEAMRHDDSELGRLWTDLNEFVDTSNSARASRWVWRAAGSAKIWE